MMMKMMWDTGRKSRFFIPPSILRPRLGGHSQNTKPFGMEKLEWSDCRTVIKLLIWFDRILACDRQMERRTDKRTDILQQHNPRGKNIANWSTHAHTHTIRFTMFKFSMFFAWNFLSLSRKYVICMCDSCVHT